MASKHARISIDSTDDRLTRAVFIPSDTKFEKQIQKEKRLALGSFLGSIFIIVQFFIVVELLFPSTAA